MALIRIAGLLHKSLTQTHLKPVVDFSFQIRHLKNLRRMGYDIIESGIPNGDDYKIYYKNDKGPISPLHDIPLFSDPSNQILNMVVEIPRWTNAKMEIDTKSALNPIKQDVKNGKLRYVANCFPHHGYIWNYGAFPQTWEYPGAVDSHTGYKGDNDPIDVLEIGHRVAKRGEVLQVKVLGVIALIDEGETDWKIYTIDINDPLAPQMNDIGDVDKHYPGLLKATIEWFKIYKMPDGKPENKFAFNGEAKDKDFALNVISDTHKHWNGLLKKELDGGKLATSNLTIEGSPFKISYEDAKEIVSKAPKLGQPLETDPIIDKWHFLHLK